MKQLRERDIESYLKKKVRERGGEVRKVKWIGRKYAPDRLVMVPDAEYPNIQHFARTTWVEVKAPGLAATFPKDAHERGQAREHERMRALGQCVVVIDSIQQVDVLLMS